MKKSNVLPLFGVCGDFVGVLRGGCGVIRGLKFIICGIDGRL